MILFAVNHSSSGGGSVQDASKIGWFSSDGRPTNISRGIESNGALMMQTFYTGGYSYSYTSTDSLLSINNTSGSGSDSAVTFQFDIPKNTTTSIKTFSAWVVCNGKTYTWQVTQSASEGTTIIKNIGWWNLTGFISNWYAYGFSAETKSHTLYFYHQGYSYSWAAVPMYASFGSTGENSMGKYVEIDISMSNPSTMGETYTGVIICNKSQYRFSIEQEPYMNATAIGWTEQKFATYSPHIEYDTSTFSAKYYHMGYACTIDNMDSGAIMKQGPSQTDSYGTYSMFTVSNILKNEGYYPKTLSLNVKTPITDHYLVINQSGQKILEGWTADYLQDITIQATRGSSVVHLHFYSVFGPYIKSMSEGMTNLGNGTQPVLDLFHTIQIVYGTNTTGNTMYKVYSLTTDMRRYGVTIVQAGT